MIRRPDLIYNDAKHEYRLNGERLLGVSTVAKIGDTDVWGVASAWAFRIGYEGAFELYDATTKEDDWYATKDDLREALKQAKKTPWHKSGDAKDRGNAIHEALEFLAQENKVPVLEDYPQSQRGYIKGLCSWYIDYRPEFVATEVQVVSERHLFAGRYDMRCKCHIARRCDDVHAMPRQWQDTTELWLVDLKTGKYIYPTSQFPQLAGYELASVEMGYPATDGQYILNVHDDGTYDFERSVATAEHFLSYLSAQRAILDLETKIKKGR
jgi:hypothetical protein